MPSIPAHITTVGVKRPEYGKAGRAIDIIVNALPATIPEGNIYHYDVITPDNNPPAFNTRIIRALQDGVALNVFAEARAVYDGKKNLYSSVRLNLPGGDTASYDVPIPGQAPQANRPPRVVPVRLALVNTIGTELLHRFIAGQQSEDDRIKTALQALNIVIKMAPSLVYPTKGRSFFTPAGKKPIGKGLELWRGYFQSVRPTLGRMLVNVDISTGVMYAPGPLVELCAAYLEVAPARLNAGMPDRIRIKLQRFLVGLRVSVVPAGGGEPKIYSIKRSVRSPTIIAPVVTTTPLRAPQFLCVEIGQGALIPLERCTVLPGQLFKKEFPDDKRTEMVEFSTQKPPDRFQSIRNSLQVLAYGQSDYVRKFGMDIGTELIRTKARVLNPPRLKYGGTGPKAIVEPRTGTWNMADKRFIEPAEITTWVLAILDARFPDQAVNAVATDLVRGCQSTGMTVKDPIPVIRRINPQSDIMPALLDAGAECNRTKGPPSLFVIVLPESGNAEIYNVVKHWGDIRQGVATQCLKAKKCARANMQYWANVALKINVKKGGINVITDPSQVGTLGDPHQPTIVMGADVMHPPPGATDRPSFASVVGSVDSNAAKYVSTMSIQRGRVELIEALGAMTKEMLDNYVGYRRQKEKLMTPPKRLIFYRDGVSESQFLQVLEQELPLIKEACRAANINPKITLIVVGKRHHFRFLPANERDMDRSLNAPAGTVVDRDIGHPLELDFYLQSHAGLLGTSRPSHYSVLYDENNFSPDALQSLSYALCHVYARATRSVSIPAPVYYADICCSRAKHHFNPQGSSETATTTSADPEQAYQALEAEFQKINAKQAKFMYFS
ncbi:Argonaute-like protein [Mycena chlorophos]|uniref:Argonaute-like protein n=1 Tax=Mycena chlorophos TaxID=658473 RepID=A0A8H6SBH4_MYCCL|nr:Argonaute-like protein [Mycena chlorophos]